ERIRVAGELISDEAMEALISEVEAANAGEPISFFEFTTVLALQAFAQVPADLCLIEVGLGGRFDATNIFEAPALSVITPVDYDHLEMLGPELSKIAWEKAGIIKAGRPVVVARQMEEALGVITAEAESLGAPMTLIGADADAWEANGRLLVQWGEQLLDLPPPALFGPHQFDNAGLAVTALLTLGDPHIDEDAIARGVATAQWPARFQRLREGALAQMASERGAVLWLDGGHNPHAGAALAQALARLTARDPRPVVLIVAMFARKDAVGFFAPFAELAPQVVTTSFDSPNAAPAQEIADAARATGLSAQTAADVTAALSAALAPEGPAPHVLICGGLHFAGEVLAMDPATWPR
ncbi:MAG: bifunctional folylpolyglutamate synthase/dihydrofolate synthase, partial [Alphaproteobacteria bacterium]|nr:bifunctional folylpolyglutamate synthase/dihydrofolate synthase [Alphaproteobacteria bacterium]